MQENALFHRAILTLSDNAQTLDLHQRLQAPMYASQNLDRIPQGAMQTATREHRRIARAILARDASAAVSIMRTHLGRAAEIALRHPLDQKTETVARAPRRGASLRMSSGEMAMQPAVGARPGRAR